MKMVDTKNRISSSMDKDKHCSSMTQILFGIGVSIGKGVWICQKYELRFLSSNWALKHWEWGAQAPLGWRNGRFISRCIAWALHCRLPIARMLLEQRGAARLLCAWAPYLFGPDPFYILTRFQFSKLYY